MHFPEMEQRNDIEDANGVRLAADNSTVKSNKSRGVLIETMMHVTTVVHTVVLAFLVLILYACFSSEWVFFTWHPFLLTVGWWFLATEGILHLRKDNIISAYTNHKWKIRLHWLFETVGVLCTLAGCAIAFINKNNNSYPHFTTNHGKFGLAVFVCCILTAVGGAIALYSVALRKYLKPNLNKAGHAFFGMLSFGLGFVTVVLGLYSNWFKNRVGESEGVKLVFVVVLALAGVWILARPFVGFVDRIRSSFK